MITGAHFLLYSTDPDADRRFLGEVLGLTAVDAGGGWLIFALPPAEMGVHPADGSFVQRHADHDLTGILLYLMCDDVQAEVESLTARGVPCTPVDGAEWGRYSIVGLPSGGKLGLYQPAHPTAIATSPARA
jgi:predicted enzyme related to lactoylglutathione lyase